MWNRWKLKIKGVESLKEHIGKNGIKLKSGTTLSLAEKKYEFVLLQSGAIGILWGFGEFYGPFFEIIDPKGMEIVFNER